jgi:hypothetical protein
MMNAFVTAEAAKRFVGAVFAPFEIYAPSRPGDNVNMEEYYTAIGRPPFRRGPEFGPP